MGVNGMVASAHPLASSAGVLILREGGNAFDAAVAVAATLNVVESPLSGAGGIGVALVYVAAEDRVRALDFSGRAPKAAEPSRFDEDTKRTGVLAALVPGNVAGWLTLHEAYGAMGAERLFQPAIDYAENGFPVTQISSHMMAQAAQHLAAFPSASIVLDGTGRAPRPGSRLRMPQLGNALRQIATGGKETFYRGELAERIVRGNQEAGGLFALEDLAEYEARWQEPISTGYRGYEVLTTPPNSGGFQILQTLRLMEGFREAEIAFQHPDTLHLFMESAKLCVADRIRYGGDPDHVRIPLRGLLSEEYASKQRQRIDRASAAMGTGERYLGQPPEGALTPGTPEFDGGMTTFFTVADRDGNVVSVTQTLGGVFGCAMAMGDTGIFLNNMCSWFDLEEGSPNIIGPGKRVDFVVAPTQTLKRGRPFLSAGTPGSYGILQTTPQVLINVLDFGMTIQQAIDAPRFRCRSGLDVDMEERFPSPLRRAMTELGHNVTTVEPYSPGVGGAQGVHMDQDTGVFQGGADPRRDGYAIGW